MKSFNSIFKAVKPGIPKRYLLFVAAFMWTFAGGMLLFRGFSMLRFGSIGILTEESVGIIAGIAFYIFMFSKISLKHITRILNLQIDKPCLFSFFNWRSYFMMTLMISLGITLRLTGIVPIQYLSLFYVAMGTPLFMSAFRFYYHGFKYRKSIDTFFQSK